MNKYYKNLVPANFKTTDETVISFFKILFNKDITEIGTIPNLKKYYSKRVVEKGVLVVGIGAGARYKMLRPNLFVEILKIFINKKEG